MTTQSFSRRHSASLHSRSRIVPKFKPRDRWAIAVWGGIALVFFVLVVSPAAH